MGIEFGKNDFEDDSIVLGADRDHAIDYPDPVASRAEQAFMDSLPREKRRQRFHSLRERPEGNEYTVSGMGNLVADITPVIGDIKAAYELPNDLSYAFELVERGYEERDLKKMGLGGAFATLSAMGIIPAVRIGAKAGKEAIKASIKAPEGLDIKPEDIKAAEAAKQFLSQEAAFDDLEETVAPKKDIFGLTPKVQDELISDFEMLGNAQNQIVTNKQIKEVIEIKTGFTPNVQTTNEIQAALNDKGISTINSFDEFKKLTGQDIQELSIQPRIDYASTANQVKTKYLDKSKGIENIDEITKIINDQDLGLTSPSAIKALAAKQNNEVSKQQLFHILEHYKDAPLDEADYKATMKYFQNTEGVKIVDDAPPLDKSQTTAKKDAIQQILADTKNYVKTEDTLIDLAEKQAIGGTAKIISTDQLQYVVNKNIPNYTPQQMEEVVNYLTSKNVTIAANPEALAKNTGADFTQLDGLNKLMEDLADKAGMSFKLTKEQYDDLVKNAFGTETPTTNQTDFLNKILTDKNILAVSQTKPKADVIGGTFAKMDVDMTPDQKFLVDKIREKKAQLRGFIDQQSLTTPYLSNKGLKDMPFTENQMNLIDRINTIDFTGKKFDMRNKADQIEIAKLLPKPIRRAMIQELNRPVPKIFHGSAGISQPYGRGTAYAGMTRAEVLEKEGFMPFTDFEEGVEVGIGGSKGASGKHAELGKKMLSTSRDPLVSIKRSFGDLVPANVVSAPFPRGKVRGMTREEYTAPSTKSQYTQDDTAAGLPRTRHKEAEIAFSTPEELENIRQLSQRTVRLEDSVDRDKLKNLGKMSLEDRVKTGQRFATGVKDNINSFYTRMNTLNPSSPTVAKRVQDGYADLRNLLKDLQALGQFTEQYGARGTYDSLLQTLFKDTDRTVEKLGRLLPEGEKKENVQMLASVFDVMKDKQYLTDTGKSSLRGVSDKKLKERLKGFLSAMPPHSDKPINANYEDLKRMVFLLTDKFNRGGLMARR